jgi:type II secretory pathway component PulF
VIDAASAQPRRIQLFEYIATNPDGTEVKGVMEAADSEAVWHAIAVRGLRPSAVKVRSRAPLRAFLDGLTKVKLQEIVVFCRQLSTFVRVGVPLTSALETIAKGTGTNRMRQACASMVADLERGGLLSAAIVRHPQVFPPVLADLLRASEMTGHIDEVLIRSADHFERELETRTKIRGALMYPANVLCMALAVGTGLVVFVLPQFRELFAEYGAKTSRQ